MHYLAALLPFAALTTASRDNLQVPVGSALYDQMPLLGFGTWNLDRDNASAAVSHALQTGYRHIDCAAIYGNEPLVGKGLADGLKKAEISREDIWVTSKLWNDQYVPCCLLTTRLTTTATTPPRSKKQSTRPSQTSASTT